MGDASQALTGSMIRRIMAQSPYPSSLYLPSRSLVSFFSKQGLVVRNDHIGDAEDVQALMLGVFDEFHMRLGKWYAKHPEAFPSEYYGPDLQRRLAFVVENERKRIVGSALLIKKKDAPDAKGANSAEQNTGEISKMYLVPELRGKGLGRRLLEELVAKAPKFGYDKLFLTSRAEFKDALKLYEAAGFKYVKNTRYKAACSLAMELRL